MDISQINKSCNGITYLYEAVRTKSFELFGPQIATCVCVPEMTRVIRKVNTGRQKFSQNISHLFLRPRFLLLTVTSSLLTVHAYYTCVLFNILRLHA